MNKSKFIGLRLALLAGSAAFALAPAAALAQQASNFVAFDIPAQDLDSALTRFGQQSDREIIISSALTRDREAPAVQGNLTPEAALGLLLADSGLTYRVSSNGSLVVEAAQNPQSGSAAGDGAEVEALIVTAQKREEDIQDVPIAISAFTQEALEAQKIEGGFDLLKAIPNVTFSKNNFSGYNFSIRGIGTKAVSVTTDPGVAVEFNETPIIRNRLFEQEYFDVERVEVLRGPQGTLHGRNATSGVINVISAKPDLDEFEGFIKGEVGNYNAKRATAMVNVPLLNDIAAVRLAGAYTVRDGYGTNLFDGSDVDGRDLWSTRLTVGFKPTERFRADLIWERFHEDDNRQRTGKQLCTHDPGPTHLGDMEIVPEAYNNLAETRGIFSQGCLPGSLYDDAAYGTPNGFAIPFVAALSALNDGAVGSTPNGQARAIQGIDPYGNTTQSHDLRAFYSQIKSIYRAQADVVELNASFDLTDNLTLTSLTAYNKDRYYATQDFNRYTTLPVFTDTDELTFSKFGDLLSNGIFCDPQLGCSDTIVGQDLSRSKSHQFSQELRVQSDFDGPWNFSLGANYTRYHTIEDYYVFFNGITLATIVSLNGGQGGANRADRRTLNPDCSAPVNPQNIFELFCVPIETNPIDEIQDIGHNYFLNRNPYRLQSKAVFGEVYWSPSDVLKVTAGLRYTDDRKVFTPIPSQTALTPISYAEAKVFPPFLQFLEARFKALAAYGIGEGYPALPDEVREWQEWTGRLGVDWKPELAFTDETMVYAFYSRGYKAGGMNPPPAGLLYEAAEAAGIVYPPSVPREFAPEFVNAYELGAKNTLLDGAMTLNTAAFFYDYEGYQVSKIVDRTANNENFDAKVWGIEVESIFAPSRNLQVRASLGYLDSKIADGSYSLDIMNRTAGRDDWVLVKPALTLMSNCIVPLWVAQAISGGTAAPDYFAAACPGGSILGGTYRQGDIFGQPLPGGGYYNPEDYPEANYGAGFVTDVSGNELPNAPHWTANIGAQYGFDLLTDWRVTFRGDAYWQSQSWARVYNSDPYDKLHGWYNVNLSVWFERPDDDLKIELYAKNVLDKTPITDAFLNSDDTALTTNVFVLDPRLIGISIRKGF